MCLPNFIKFEDISEDKPLTGYRSWLQSIKEDNFDLKSLNHNYIWPIESEEHLVKDSNSGIYSYNYYSYNYNYNYYNNNYKNNNNYNNYNNNYYNYINYYNNNNYYISGIILQYGKVAIHKIGYRSEYAKVKTLFTIRGSDAKGPREFLDWIKKFNSKIEKTAERYKADTIHWQDFTEANK